MCTWLLIGARPAQGAATTTDEGFGVARLFVACGRTNVRPYGLLRRLVRGRHKARPLQLMWVWCGGWCEAGTRRGHYN
ncbi:MAG: hypothetical protein PUF32_09590 [Prevotella sp.]|nr:hypothetical protein [Prevotella sp.]